MLSIEYYVLGFINRNETFIKSPYDKKDSFKV